MEGNVFLPSLDIVKLGRLFSSEVYSYHIHELISLIVKEIFEYEGGKIYGYTGIKSTKYLDKTEGVNSLMEVGPKIQVYKSGWEILSSRSNINYFKMHIPNILYIYNFIEDNGIKIFEENHEGAETFMNFIRKCTREEFIEIFTQLVLVASQLKTVKKFSLKEGFHGWVRRLNSELIVKYNYFGEKSYQSQECYMSVKNLLLIRVSFDEPEEYDWTDVEIISYRHLGVNFNMKLDEIDPNKLMNLGFKKGNMYECNKCLTLDDLTLEGGNFIMSQYIPSDLIDLYYCLGRYGDKEIISRIDKQTLEGIFRNTARYVSFRNRKEMYTMAQDISKYFKYEEVFRDIFLFF